MLYWILFFTFFKIGAFTFGGGYAMLPFIQQEVIKNQWITQEEIINFIAISESTPGPFGVNISTFVGMKTAGIGGAVLTMLGVVLPSFVIILIFARVFESFQQSKIVKGAMLGLKGAVVGMIGSAVVSTVISVFGRQVQNQNVIELLTGTILLGCMLIGIKKKVNPILLILISAVIGIIIKPILPTVSP